MWHKLVMTAPWRETAAKKCRMASCIFVLLSGEIFRRKASCLFVSFVVYSQAKMVWEKKATLLFVWFTPNRVTCGMGLE